MECIAQINGRKVFYAHVDEAKLPAHFPVENVCMLAVADDVSKEKLQAFSDAALVKNVKYFCAVGKDRDALEFAFDTSSIEKHQFVMTTGHDDLKEAVWFASKVAYHEKDEITALVCIIVDNDEAEKRRLIDAIRAVESGWEPAD